MSDILHEARKILQPELEPKVGHNRPQSCTNQAKFYSQSCSCKLATTACSPARSIQNFTARDATASWPQPPPDLHAAGQILQLETHTQAGHNCPQSCTKQAKFYSQSQSRKLATTARSNARREQNITARHTAASWPKPPAAQTHNSPFSPPESSKPRIRHLQPTH